MTAILRELPSGKGFKLSYQYGERVETATFYYSRTPENKYGIIRDDIVMDSKNKLHQLLEIVEVNIWGFDQANEHALFRSYEHARNHANTHSFITNQPLIDKTRFSKISKSEEREFKERIYGGEIFLRSNWHVRVCV